MFIAKKGSRLAQLLAKRNNGDDEVKASANADASTDAATDGITETYTYSSDDREDNDNISPMMIMTGHYMTKIKNVDGNNAGSLSWTLTGINGMGDEWIVSEHLILALDGKSWHGCSTNITDKGSYIQNKPYNFHCKGKSGTADVTITKIGPGPGMGVRNVVVTRNSDD